MKGVSIIILCIILVSGGLRFYDISNQSIWYDEQDTFQRVVNLPQYLPLYLTYQDGTYNNITSPQAAAYDFNGFSIIPPFYFLAIYSFNMFFDWDVIGMRYFSAIIGILSILSMYFLAKELYSPLVGVLCTLYLALNPYHLYFSQEARMYTLTVFTGILLLYFFWRALSTNYLLWWVGFGFFVALNLYIHTFALFLIIACWSYFFLYFSQFKKSLASFFLSQCFAVILFIPWIPIYIYQIAFGSYYNWIKFFPFQVIDVAATLSVLLLGQTLVIKESPPIIFYPVLILLFLIAILPILLLVLHRWKKVLPDHRLGFLLIIFLLPLLMMSTYSLLIENVFQFRYLLYLQIPLIILLVQSHLHLKKFFKYTCIVLFILLMLWADYNYFTRPAKPDYKHAIEYINQNSLSGDILFYHVPNIKHVIEYYHPKIPIHFIGTFQSQYLENEDLINVNNLLAEQQRAWILLGHSRAYKDIKELAIKEFTIEEPYFLGIKVLRLERKKS